MCVCVCAPTPHQVPRTRAVDRRRPRRVTGAVLACRARNRNVTGQRELFQPPRPHPAERTSTSRQCLRRTPFPGLHAHKPGLLGRRRREGGGRGRGSDEDPLEYLHLLETHTTRMVLFLSTFSCRLCTLLSLSRLWESARGSDRVLLELCGMPLPRPSRGIGKLIDFFSPPPLSRTPSTSLYTQYTTLQQKRTIRRYIHHQKHNSHPQLSLHLID